MSQVRQFALVVVASVAILLSGCASQMAAEVDLPAQDQSRWVMPLDEFQGPSATHLPNYAENLLIADCLGENGIEWPIPWQPTDDASYLKPPANLSYFPALTVELAQESGYRAEFTPGFRPEDRFDTFRALNGIAASTPGFQPLFDSCLGEAREQVPTLEITGASNRLSGWNGEALNNARQTTAVADADAAWQQCMKDAGYIAVPVSPLGGDEWMPTQALRDELGIPNRWGPGDGAPENALTPQEVALAVDDATCRESSGWSEAIYQATWDAQAELVTEHADELIRLRDEWQAARDAILIIIAAHAPSH